MNNYLVTVRLGRRLVKTKVAAESSQHASLLVQYAYGINSVATNPILLSEGDVAYPHYKSITPKPPSIKPHAPSDSPKSPPNLQQAQVNGLKQKVAQDRLKVQQLQAQQRQQRDVKKLVKQRQSIAKIPR